MGGYEVGLTISDRSIPVDGAKLSYFESGTGSSAEIRRIAYYNGSAYPWLLRSPDISSNSEVFITSKVGNVFNTAADSVTGIRPALVLPSNALFDGKTMLLKEVA